MTLNLPLVAHGQLVVQHQFQELGVVQPIGAGLLQADVERFGQTGQAQLLEGFRQLGVNQGRSFRKSWSEASE